MGFWDSLTGGGNEEAPTEAPQVNGLAIRAQNFFKGALKWGAIAAAAVVGIGLLGMFMAGPLGTLLGVGAVSIAGLWSTVGTAAVAGVALSAVAGGLWNAMDDRPVVAAQEQMDRDFSKAQLRKLQQQREQNALMNQRNEFVAQGQQLGLSPNAPLSPFMQPPGGTGRSGGPT